MPRRRYQPMERGFMTTGEYERGYEDGYYDGRSDRETIPRTRRRSVKPKRASKPRKLSTWQRFIKNKKNHIKLRNGKLNLKKMAVQYRKKHKK